jgi:hypothetical protein
MINFKGAVDLTGHIFNRFTVLKRVGTKGHYATYLCRCICGTEKILQSTVIKRGFTKSCGCLRKEGKKGINSPGWKGGRRKGPKGYVLIYMPNHPNVKQDGYVWEHQYIMSEYLGRPLTKDETVHHKNGIRNDNKIENLELMCKHHFYGQRVSDLVKFAKEIIIKYENYGS